MTKKKNSVKKSTDPKTKKRIADVDSQQSGWPIPDIGASVGTRALIESEEPYRLFEVILRSASDGILAVNRENKVLFANERFVEMWSIPQELMDKRNDTLLLQYVLDQLSNPQDFLEKVQELYNSPEESFDTLYFKDGRIFDRLSRPMLQGKNLLGRVWSFRDITERKRVEEALVKEQYEMQILMNNLPTQIYFKDRASRFTRISKSQAELFNLSDLTQAIGKTDFDFFTEEHARQAYEDEQAIIQTGQPVIKEEKETWADRPDRWVSTTKMPIRDNEGNIIGTFGISTDITERKQAQEELQFRNIVLSTQQEASIDGILVVDENAHILMYNRRFVEMWGIPAKLVEEGVDEQVLQFVAAQTADPKAFLQRVQYLYEHRWEASQDELILSDRRVFDRYTAPMFGSREQYFGRVWYFRDVTERRQAEEELRHVTDELASLNLELQQSLEREQLLSCTDGLTGLSNHRYLFELAAREFHTATRYQRPLAFLMFDIDRFKQVNDTLGHEEGNKLLVTVAQISVAHVRASDIVARYGGDEFIVILPNTSAQNALPVAERIRANVAAMRVGTDKEPLTVTLSMGVADIRKEPADKNVEQIIQRADEALYQAKYNGRNRVVIFGQEETGSLDG